MLVLQHAPAVDLVCTNYFKGGKDSFCPIIGPAASAQSAREFHAAMDGWLAMAAPLVAQMESFTPGRGRGSGGYEGYDEMEMYDEMDMEMEMEMEDYDEEMMDDEDLR